MAELREYFDEPSADCKMEIQRYPNLQLRRRTPCAYITTPKKLAKTLNDVSQQ